MSRGVPAWIFPLIFIAGFAWILLSEKDVPGARARLLFLVSDPGAELVTKAADLLYTEHPELARTVDIRLRAPSNSAVDAEMPPHDLLAAEVKASPWILDHKDVLSGTAGGAPRIAVGRLGPGLAEADLPVFGLRRDPMVDQYWDHGAPGQVMRMIRYLLYRYLGYTHLDVEPPAAKVEQGYVVWIDGRPRVVETWEEWEAAARPDPGLPKVAVLEYATRVRRESIDIPKALADAVSQEGLQPVFAFATGGAEGVVDLLFGGDGRPRVDAVISMHFKFFDDAAAETLERLDVPVINAIQVYGRTVDEWKASSQGLTAGEIAWQLAVPELAGLSPPNVVGGPANNRGDIAYLAIPERARRAAGRARHWIELKNTPPEDRRVAVLYWNYPPGKQNVGASYLNVVRGMPVLLRELRARGYETGGWDVENDPRSLEDAIVRIGRNIGRWAPGELDRAIRGGGAERVSLSRYKEWFSELPREFRETVTEHWGPPEDADIMAREIDGEKRFVLPLVRAGNVVFMPQPDRARTQNLDLLYQSQELPPHHQYVAAYLWLQREFKAHAVVHTGTHGTHEWLSGKEAGLSGSDPGEVLAGTLPILYPYIVDDVGEGIVAKRRGMATVIDHLTPALGEGGLSPELSALLGRVQEWRNAMGSDPESAGIIAGSIRDEVVKRGLHLDLRDRGWAEDELDDPAGVPGRMAVLEDYIRQIQSQSIPFGLHTFGISPEGERLDGYAQLIAGGNDPARIDEYRAGLIESGTNEMRRLAHGLSGGFIAPGPGNDPVRNPDAVPTGKNFYTFDPRVIPAPDADDLGRRLAEEFIENHRIQHGAFPEKIALQVWGVETIRHMGAQEAQGLALLGVRPVRGERGRVVDLELIPREELGRPRVDVVFYATSLYRDTFPILIEMIDKAVRLAAASPEEDNPIRAHAAETAARLMEAGVPEEEARNRALVRVFAEPTGKHDSKIHAMTASSGSWEEEKQVGETYIRRMGHGYGGGIWGEPMEREFRDSLAGTEAIVHTRASKLYSTLDNDDYFSYGGSIALGVRTVDGGASPPFFVTDLRTPGRERHEPLERFLGQEFRARYLNPGFAKAMMDEGYAGARHVWKAAEYLWGWQVVYPETVDGAKWTELYEVWLRDRYDLGMEAFFAEHNPHAKQGIAARMLEAVRKGYWDAPGEIIDDLTEMYIEQVAEHDVACDHLTCDNPDLQAYIRERAATVPGLNPETVAQWIDNVQRATGRTIDDALAQRVADRQRWHAPREAETPDRAAAGPAPSEPRPIEGQVMEEIDITAGPPQTPAPDPLSWLVTLAFFASWAAGAANASRRF